MKNLVIYTFFAILCYSNLSGQNQNSTENDNIRELNRLINDKNKMIVKADNGEEVFAKCRYELNSHIYYSKLSEQTAKQIKEEKRKASQATTTYARNSYVTRHNNLIKHYEKEIETSKKYYSEYRLCHDKENRRFGVLSKKIETLKKQLLNNTISSEETPTVTHTDNAKKLHEQAKNKLNQQYNRYNNRRETSETHTLNSPKEYGLMIIRKLAKQGDVDAKKILSSNRIQEDGFTIFSHKGQPLFISYKMEIPERNEIVFRRITNDDFGLLVATEDIPSNKRGKAGLLYFDKKLKSSKRNGIGTSHGKKDFPKSTYVKTEIKYLDNSYEETSRENADYYEIRDTFLDPSKNEKSRSDELSISIETSTIRYIRIERRDINHKLIIYRIFEEDAIDDDHTYFYNDKN